MPEPIDSPVSASPFDLIAETYDAGFTERPVARHYRRAVWRCLERAFGPGDSVVDLGCGTGEDALHLAERGVSVRALDSSERMLDVARDRASAHMHGWRVSFGKANFESLTRRDLGLARSQRIDGAFSNFGALNCLPERRQLAGILSSCVRKEGRLVLVLMGPFCPWEWVWYGGRGRIRTAFRRFRSGHAASVGGRTVPVWYPTPRRLRREFAPWFRQVSLVGTGVCLPPPFAADPVENRPDLTKNLARWDRRLGRHFPGTWLNDHYIMTLVRTEVDAA